MSRRELLLEAVERGKYAPLYRHLLTRDGTEWQTTFSELENILGFSLPNSAHMYRPWWANDRGAAHSQSMSWTLAGWKSSSVDMDDATLTFKKHTEEGATEMPSNENQDRLSAPKMDDFRAALKDYLLEARSEGISSVVINAGKLHRLVGGYPTPFNRMPMCCKAMYEEQTHGDRIVEKPMKDFGASLTIEYRLPR
ncbi:DUF7662 domain-containing protein [Parasphingorhabdus sp.]|uniref:DUF7662 domain-containing protein n=1 Tax=Parasphingorhabdus sp. TaxID=2709688 RepID=UPI002F92C2CB